MFVVRTRTLHWLLREYYYFSTIIPGKTRWYVPTRLPTAYFTAPPTLIHYMSLKDDISLGEYTFEGVFSEKIYGEPL